MYLNLSDILVGLLIASLAALWWQGYAVKEKATRHVKQHCKKLDLQLLDDTVALYKVSPVWQKGQLRIRRIYQFEFSTTGETRYQGFVTYVGKKPDGVQLPAHRIQ